MLYGLQPKLAVAPPTSNIATLKLSSTLASPYSLLGGRCFRLIRRSIWFAIHALLVDGAGDFMKLTKICIRNFRSLKNLQVDLEEYLSIIVGKNNSGKTSLLLVLERFLSSNASPRFDFDDFNTEFQNYLVDLLDGTVQPGTHIPSVEYL